MTPQHSDQSVSRRTAFAGLAAGGVGVALGARVRLAAAQDATPASLAGHPQVGVWMVDTSIERALAVYAADGSVVTALAASQAGPQGVTFSSTQVGTWEPTGERSTHLTAVQLLSDGAGAYVGSVTVDAYQTLSADGQRFTSDPATTLTFRDAADNVVQVIGPDAPGPPATGVRMGVGSPGFPVGTPSAGTPTA